MAITKKHKEELVAEYQDWLNRSKVVILAEYVGLSMKDMDALRTQVRAAGGEFHVVKNTLGKVAFEGVGVNVPHDFFEGSTAAGFAFQDAPALAKTIIDFAKTSDFLKIKGGFLDAKPVSAAQVQSLAELPPLPVMRARLLGVLMAPASQLARTLAEPGRMIAAVIKAQSEKSSAVAQG